MIGHLVEMPHLVNQHRTVSCCVRIRWVAGIRMAAACSTGGILIVFHARPARTTTVASRFLGMLATLPAVLHRAPPEMGYPRNYGFRELDTPR